MLGSIIGAGASLLGGILGNNAQEKANKQNIALQREFATSGIQMKVADAKKAGVHPLYALGAQTHSFSPSVVGSTSLAQGVSQAGQDIGRAVDATRSSSGRVDAYTRTLQALQLQRAGLENDLLKQQVAGSRIATLRQAGGTPPMPTAGDRYLVDGQSGSGLVKTSPMARESTAPTAGSQEAGAVSETGYLRTPTGYAPVMSKDAKERLEEDLIGGFVWNMRNRLAPSFESKGNPPAMDLGPNEFWYYNPFRQEYQLRKLKRGQGGFVRWQG